VNAAGSVVERIEGAGGTLAVNGKRIRVRLPEDVAHLVEELRAHKVEVLSLLRKRGEILVPPARIIVVG
jgi:hypothetical protein